MTPTATTTTPADPRVLFAAERTLLAWQRTCLTLMGFGFLIERFGLFVRFMQAQGEPASTHSGLAHLIGVGVILFGAAMAALASLQHQRVLRTLNPADVPPRYWLQLAPLSTWMIAILGTVIALYLMA